MPSIRQALKLHYSELAVAVFCLAVIVVLWATTIDRIRSERAETISAVYKQNSNLAIAYEEHTVRTLKSVDQVLLSIKSQYETRGPKANLQRLIESGVIDGELFVVLEVLDENGRLIASNSKFQPVNFAHENYFEAHRQQRLNAMLIGAPLKGRLAGRVIFPMSRRINKENGSFGGVVFAGIDPSYFTTFYEKTDLGKMGAVSLIGLDGIALVRRAGEHSTFGEDLHGTTLLERHAQSPVGNFTGVGRIDRVPRFFSYRTAQQYPLIVSVGTAEDEALASFHEHERDYYVRTAVASLLAALFGTGLIAALWRRRRAADALARSDIQFRTYFTLAAVGIAHTDFSGKFLRINRKLCEMLGYTEEEMLMHSFRTVSHPEDIPDMTIRQRMLAGDAMAVAETREKRYVRKDGSVMWAIIAVTLVRDLKGNPDYFVTVVQDISERKRMEERLRKFSHAIEQSPAQTVITDTQGRIEYVNPKFSEVTGYAADELIGKTPAVIKSGVTPIEVYQELWRTILAGREWQGEVQNRRKNGELYWEYEVISPLKNERGEIVNFIAIKEDITERKEMRDLLVHQAHYDSLTQLPNRLLCYDRLRQAINYAQRRKTIVGVLFIDLDRFKGVNDALGHAFGDLLLQQVAQRMKANIRSEDTAARLGGDEFMIVLAEVAEANDCRLFAQKLMVSLSKPFQLDGHELYVTASIGIATYPHDGEDVETLIKNADAAMFRAKDLGRNGYRFYDAPFDEQAQGKPAH